MQRTALASLAGLSLLSLSLHAGFGLGDLVGDVVEGTTGHGKEARAIINTVQAVDRATEEITPEQEYYLGRSVAAGMLSRYQPLNNEQAHHYINLLGQSIALASNRPQTFGGYRFLILDSMDINAVACPGGIIMITRGMIRCCKSEDELAAILAHEIAHVELNHAIRSIDRSRWTDAALTAGLGAASTMGSQDLQRATDVFGETVDDLTSTLLNNGYSRDLEYEADEAALRILRRLGYDQRALLSMLKQLEQRISHQDILNKTHPDPEDRIDEIEDEVSSAGLSGDVATRTQRFQQYLGNL